MKKQSLALFDFDGTLYLRDSFTKFIFYVLKSHYVIAKGIALIPWVKKYYLNLYPAPDMRKKLFYTMFEGLDAKQIHADGENYAKTLLADFNPILWAQLKQHQALGHRIVLVSASVDLYLKPLCDLLDIDLICSKVETVNGLLTGLYMGEDCSSDEKKKQIMKKYAINDYDIVYGYGNTHEDHAMLSLAHHSFIVGKDDKLPRISN
ncbi:HAD-IB family phosphatase [Acinetobacter sp. ESL0695]|jgi:HAD superfamily hydrolase (TIGR01490 family)|uniref:HAD-IB family phosphatase n=1 Tax=Acinetobacter pollinis TaxID=2605270 RepID=A0ABU6DUA9_9GAMM|nr:MULTISPECIES: HAD-IB family phosphatase [Acinetobacter]MEB5477446.1 HAD-IB family phosphatase [Acinetobacter pollinis]WEV49927.1 HAD-IB family phosphatase [Acinetobacter sp. ESL0695]